jgi:hypothetical protein
MRFFNLVSFPRKRNPGPRHGGQVRMPAFAGMTVTFMSHPSFSTTRATRTGKLARPMMRWNTSSPSPPRSSRRAATPPRLMKGSPRGWERRRPGSPGWRGETMPSTSTLSASPRRPVPACGFQAASGAGLDPSCLPLHRAEAVLPVLRCSGNDGRAG